MQIPIGMVVTSVEKFSNDKCQIFGFWYYKDLYVPATEAEKKRIFSDLIHNKCKQLKITGSLEQIGHMLLQSDRFQSADKNATRMYVTLMNKLEDEASISISFDDVMTPQGTGLSIDTVCEFDETVETIRAKIFAETDFIELEISNNWSLLNLFS